MRLQHYVSPELHHFVGRRCSSDDERYDLLRTILRSGELRPGPAAGYAEAGDGVAMIMKLAPDGTLPVTVVCFCDIPSDDLYLHISKYGPFGISFPKAYLLNRGANPVYYVAMDSRATLSHEHAGEDLGALFRREFNDLIESDPNFRAPASADAVEHGKAIRRFRFLRNHVIAYVKPFDVLGIDGLPRPDDDPDNFYMEREWRVLGRVEFALSDVVRITLPRRFAARFRSDFPDYRGQLSLADSWIVRIREAALGIRRAVRRALRVARRRAHGA